MKLNAIHIKLLFCLALLVSACSLGSCSHGADEPPYPDGVAYVSFSVVVPTAPEARNASRADDGTWGGDYDKDPGDGIDSDILNLTMVVTDGACTREIARIANFDIYGPFVTQEYTYYTLFRQIPAETAQALKDAGNTKVHVYTNVDSPDAVDLLASPSFSRWGNAAKVGSIPMWGVQTVDFSGMEAGKVFEIKPDIWLLRALAKVEILVDDSGTNTMTGLISATVSGIRGSAYLLPAGWNTHADTRQIKYGETINAFPTGHIPVTESFGPETSGTGAGRKIVFYIPETVNADGSARISLTYNYTDTDPLTHKEETKKVTNEIHFAEYDTDGRDPVRYNDIVRNHLYRFVVRRSPDLKIVYTVCPWQSYKIDVPPFN